MTPRSCRPALSRTPRAARHRPPGEPPEPLAAWLCASVPSALCMLRGRFGRWPIDGLDPEDVVAEASLVALERAQALRERSAPGFRAWFHGICARRAIEALRRQARAQPGRSAADAPPDPALLVASPEPEPALLLAVRESGARDARTLAALGARERSVLVLREILGASWSTIARLGGWSSPDAARKAHERARARLETRMGRCRA